MCIEGLGDHLGFQQDTETVLSLCLNLKPPPSPAKKSVLHVKKLSMKLEKC